MRISALNAATALCALALTGFTFMVTGPGSAADAAGPGDRTARVDHACPTAAWPYNPGACATGATDAAAPNRRVRVIALDATPAVPVRR